MRPKLSIKLMLRSPVKTTVTFLLLVAITFALFSRILDFGATTRRFEAADAAYRGVGWVEESPAMYTDLTTPFYLTGHWYNPDNPLDGTWEDTRYEALTADQMEAVANLPYVSSTSTRYLTAGVSPQFKRIDGKPTFYNYTTRYVFEGNFFTISSKDFYYLDYPRLVDYEMIYSINMTDCYPITSAKTTTDYSGRSLLHFSTINRPLVARDYPTGIVDFSASNRFWIYNKKAMGGKIYADKFAVIGINRTNLLYSTSLPIDFDIEEKVSFEEKCLVIAGHVDYFGYSEALAHIFLGDSVAEYWCHPFVPLGEYDDDYLDLPEFEGYRQLIEITNQDYYTFDVVYTDDMAAIPRFNDRKMGMEEGRMLTVEDEGSEVCIISRELAKRHGLKVGDSFPLGLCDKLFEQHAGLGAVAATRGRFTTPVKDVNPTIVGIYRDYDSEHAQGLAAHHSYSTNTVFVPLSMLPESADTANAVIKPGSFSFSVLDKTKLTSFTEEAAPMIGAMGLTLTFSDGGWSDAVRGFTLARTVSLVVISALSVAMAAATGLMVNRLTDYLKSRPPKRQRAKIRTLANFQ